VIRPEQEQLPAVRPLTRLMERNSRDLVLDLEEMDENHEHRWVTLVGLKAELSPPFRKNVECALQPIRGAKHPVARLSLEKLPRAPQLRVRETTLSRPSPMI
jgi:hypothetical protein